MSALAMTLAAALIVPGTGPESVSWEIEECLYSDAAVEKLVGDRIDDLNDKGYVSLRVVPNGRSYPRREVFQMLGIDEKRLGERSSAPCMMISTLKWQISSSYNITFMTAYNDPANKGLHTFDPRRKVYGVRIQKRTPTD